MQNRDVLMKMLRTRCEIASSLGYKSWADYNAADKMIGTGARIAEFIRGLDAGQELPRPPAVYGGIAALDGHGIQRSAVLNARLLPLYRHVPG